jgi:hypothetical protein
MKYATYLSRTWWTQALYSEKQFHHEKHHHHVLPPETDTTCACPFFATSVNFRG